MSEEQAAQNGAPRASRPYAPKYPIPVGAEGMLPWSHIVERLERASIYWLATMRLDGQPHVAPVWGAWLDGALYFDGLPTARWARNLAANPALAVHLESGEDVVILEGAAEDLDASAVDADVSVRIAAAYRAKYDLAPGDPLVPDAAKHGIWRLRPRVARAWTRFPEDATRWNLTP
jgi:hypothetical protein